MEADDADDRAIAAERRETKTSAILHTGHPVRYWDHDLGPGEPDLFTADAPDYALTVYSSATPGQISVEVLANYTALLNLRRALTKEEDYRA